MAALGGPLGAFPPLVAGWCRRGCCQLRASLRVRRHEEDEGELQAFRPEGYAFPVSLGRWGFELKDDHTARIFDIAAADGVDEVDGAWWTSDDGERIHISHADPARDDVSVRVQAADDDKLMLRRRAIQVAE